MVMKDYKVLFILLLGIIFAFNIAAANYVTNGAFNSGSSGWTFAVAGGAATEGYSTTLGRTANGAVRITATYPENTYSYWKQNVTLTAGHTYVLYAFIDGYNIAGGAGAGIECVTSTGTLSSMHFNGIFSWTFADLAFTPQTTSAEVRLCLGSAASQSPGTAYFDDVFLIDKNDNRLLVLVSSTLYNNHPAVRQAINTYRGDIQTMQDYFSELVRLGPGGNFQCTTAEELKTITGFYYAASSIDGLLFVGSEPDLPVAFSREHSAADIGATDLFYADVSHTWPTPAIIDGRNIYSFFDVNNDIWTLREGKQIADYHPEMFYARISAKTVKPGSSDGKTEEQLVADEAELVVDYFNRVHNYRVYGENLDSDSLNRAGLFHDDVSTYMAKSDVIGAQDHDMDLLQEMVPNMDAWIDYEITDINKYKSVLATGYRFLFLGHHGAPSNGSITRWEDNVYFNDLCTLSDMEAAGTPVKANYINLYSCSTASFVNSDPTIGVPLGKPQKYYAGYMLFNNAYTLNVTAATVGGFENNRPVFFNTLENEEPVGVAFKNHMVDKQDTVQDPLSERFLFGDPLVVYNDIRPADKGPKILPDLRDLCAIVNNEFTYTFAVGDPDDDAGVVTMTLEKDPAIVDNYNYDIGTRTLTWTPGNEDAGKYFKFKAVATDNTSSHKYSEEFTISVSHFENWLMSYDDAGGITDWQKSGAGTISDEEIRELTSMHCVSPRIRVDDCGTDPLLLSQQVFDIVPNQDYKVVLYANARLYDPDRKGYSPGNRVNLTIAEISTSFQLYDGAIAQVIPFNSGNNTSLTFTFSCVENEVDRYLDVFLGCIVLIKLPSPPQISILYKNGEQNSVASTLKPFFQVKNTGTTSVDLADVTIRYWYTKDTTAGQNFVCDYAQIGAAKVSGSFVDITPVTGADNYLLVGFAADAGILAPDAQSGEIQIRVYKNDWSNYTQSGDYSWVQNQTTYAENIKTTGYIDGVLNYGTEP